MDMSKFQPISVADLTKQHSKTLYRSICVPSTTQAYSLCIEYIRNWFLSKFAPDTFKSIYVDGKNVYDDFRKLSRTELLKRQKPSLTIVPAISWDFNNEQIDSYPYGMDLYVQTGKFKNSFFQCEDTHSYMGIGLETLLMQFGFKTKLETRAQQLDMFKYMKMACRVGFTHGEDVDLDFHVPYALMVQMARDNGFKVKSAILPDNQGTEDIIEDVVKFIRWLNMHSALPFLYKHRTLNGKNEFFLRMSNMYVHVRPTDISADDGEREGQMTNNFAIEMTAEVRFPAPKMYAYYSDNAHKLHTVYSAWYQPYGPISTCYTFKGTDIPDKNRYGWPLYMNTTYEDEECIGKQLVIPFEGLLEKEMGECILDCLSKGISPAIFCDLIFFNGGEYVKGVFNWTSLKFTSNDIVRTAGTFIGVYLDQEYLTNYVLHKADGGKDRIKQSDEQYRDKK